MIERIPAYSDKMMLEYCSNLYDVISKSNKPDNEVLDKIKRSLVHYGSASMEYRPYQQDIITSGSEILNKHGFVFLAMEVRTGKTLTSLGIAKECGAKSVLFVTKKKAIGSIENDYDILKPSFSISQMYHQVYGIPNNPFREFSNFYRFADVHVKVKQKNINGLYINDYSHGLDSIIEAMKPYMISFSQKEAGFISSVTEEILEVDIKDSVKNLIRRLERDLVVEGKEEIILADTPVKLMTKVHQLCSGTIKFESGNSMVLDTTKAEFIKQKFRGSKVGIFYKFKEELSALKEVFGDELTTDLATFDNTDKSIALQIVSGREGISLRNAVALVYYNIDFSATSYWQSRDRMTTKERSYNHVYWVFSKGGIEHDIYKAVIKKKDYTINHFKKGYGQ